MQYPKAVLLKLNSPSIPSRWQLHAQCEHSRKRESCAHARTFCSTSPHVSDEQQTSKASRRNTMRLPPRISQANTETQSCLISISRVLQCAHMGQEHQSRQLTQRIWWRGKSYKYTFLLSQPISSTHADGRLRQNKIIKGIKQRTRKSINITLPAGLPPLEHRTCGINTDGALF